MNSRLFFLLIFAFSMFCCSKTTMVSGKITNLLTGKPVTGMDVRLQAFNGHEPQDSSNPKLVGEVKTTTDTSGFYELEYSGVGIDETSLWVGGYPCGSFFQSFRSEKLRTNDCAEINIQLDEADGDLRLIFQNDSGSSDKVFSRVDCDATGPLGFYCCGTMLLKIKSPPDSATPWISIFLPDDLSKFFGASRSSQTGIRHELTPFFARAASKLNF